MIKYIKIMKNNKNKKLTTFRIPFKTGVFELVKKYKNT